MGFVSINNKRKEKVIQSQQNVFLFPFEVVYTKFPISFFLSELLLAFILSIFYMFFFKKEKKDVENLKEKVGNK